MLYKSVPISADMPCQYLGVYLLRWQREWGEPTHAFVELDDQEQEDYETGKAIREIDADPLWTYERKGINSCFTIYRRESVAASWVWVADGYSLREALIMAGRLHA